MTNNYKNTLRKVILPFLMLALFAITGITGARAQCTGASASTVSASPAGPFCISGGTTLSTSATNASDVTYQWQSSATGVSASFANTSAADTLATFTTGTITTTTYYRLIVTCAAATVSDTSNVVALIIYPIPSVFANNNGPLCAGSNATLTATAGFSTYSWSGPGTINNGTTATATAVLPTNGSSYTVTITDANGCTNSASTTVTVNANPTVTASNNGPVCAGSNASLSATTGFTTYSWSGPGTINNGSTASATAVAPANNSTYTVTVTDANGCTATDNTTIATNALPSVSASNSGPICLGTNATLNATTGLTSYSWSGPGTINNGTTASATAVTPTNNSSYTVTVTDTNGCSNTASTTVTATQPTVSASNSGPVCAGNNATLNATTGLTSYSWSGPGAINNGTTASATAVAPTTGSSYTVTVTDANGCTNTASTTVTATAAPTASAAASCASIMTGQSSTLTATATAGSGTISTYQWKKGATNVGTNSATYVATSAGSYTVTVTNSNGCSTTSSAVVITAVTGTPLSGTYNIPSTACNGFPTIAAAVNALDSLGISASVVFNIGAGIAYTETLTGPINLGSTVLNASTSATNTITFQKASTATANPVINSYVGTSQPTAISSFGDGMFNINGTDYVTINGVDLKDISALGTPAASNNYLTTMEWGYGLFKLNSSGALDGCQYDVIKNCTITLSMGTSVIRNRRNPWSIGITMDNRQYNGTMTGTIYALQGLTPTSAADCNSYNTFSGNTLYNVGNGIFMRGYYVTSTPGSTTLYDVNNVVGGNTPITGNKILSFGGSGFGSTTALGITHLYQVNCTIKNNTIDNKNGGLNGGTAAKGYVMGIFSYNTATSAWLDYNYTIANNTITIDDSVTTTLTNSSTTYPSTSGIYNYYLSGSRNISNNAIKFNITNIATAATTTSAFEGVLCYYGIIPPSNIPSYTFTFQNNTVNNCIMGSGIFYGFYIYGQGLCGTVDISGNQITGLTRNLGTTTTVTATTTYMFYNYYNPNYATSGTTTNTYNNVISNINFGNYAYASTFYGYYCGGAYNHNFYNNTISNVSAAATTSGGTIYCMYPYYGTNNNVYGNIVSNISATGTIYGMYNYAYNGGTIGLGTDNIYNNSVSNLSGATGSTTTSTIYGMLNYTYYGATANIYNNTVDQLKAVSTASGTVYGLYDYNYYNTTDNIYNNSITNLTSNYSAATIYGMYEYQISGTKNIYKNNISGITNTATAAGSAINYGLYIYGYNVNANGAGVFNIYNNIYRLSAPPHSNNIYGAVGLTLNNYSASSSYNYAANLSYNDFYMDGSSDQAAFGSAAVYQNSTSVPLTANATLKNNLFINACTNTNATPTNKCVGIRNASSTMGYGWLNNASTNNIWYAGPTSPYSGLLWDGTTMNASLSAMKGVLAPRESGSYTENPPFLSTVVGNSNFMKIDPTIGTQIESGAVQVSGITDDYAGTTRYGNTGYAGTSTVAPDCGVYEGNYVALDLSAPNIVYTALSSACGTGDRTFTANLVDVTGVDNSTYLPTAYYKKRYNGTWQTATGSLTAGTVKNGTWSFTLSSVAMGGLSIGDSVLYFVVAQDVATPTANVGSNTGGVVATNTVVITTYPTYASAGKYPVVPAMNGNYYVGAGMVAAHPTNGFNTLTAAAAAYNSYCITGPVTFLLTDSTYKTTTETFPVVFNVNSTNVAGYSVTVRPNAGNNVRFIGTSTTTAFIELNGTSKFVIDGSNTVGGTTQNMTFWNTNNAANTGVWLASTGGAGTGCTYDTVRNCAFQGGAIQGGATNIFGITGSSNAGQTSGGSDNDNDAIINCSFKSMFNAINWLGAATATASDNLYVGYNTVGLGSAYPTGTQTTASAPAGVCTNYGMYFSYCNNMNIEKNDIGGVYSYSSPYYPSGVAIGSGITGGYISKNKIHGIAMPSTGGWGAYGIYIPSGTSPANLTISSNFIYDVLTENYTNYPTIYNAYGIFLYGNTTNLNILYNTINMFGTITTGTGTGFNTCIGAYSGNVNTAITIKGNILSNTTNSATTNSWLACDYGFYNFASNIPNTGATYFDYNDIYNASSTTTGQLGTGYYLYNYNSGSGPVAYTTLSAVQQLMGGDQNSFSVLPPFVSNSDLHLNTGTTPSQFESGGYLPAAVTKDIDNDNRPGPTGSVNGGGTKPDIGADEFDGVPLIPCTTVTAGTTTGTNPICKNSSFLLNLSGATSNQVYSGLTYRWKQSTNGGATWTNATAAGVSGTAPTMISAGISTPTIYHCVLTCTLSGAKDSSTNLSLALDTFLNCYCIPVSTYGSYIAQYGYYGDITNVQFGSINNPTQSFGPAAAPFYTAYPSTINSVVVGGQSYGLSVKVDNYGYSRADAWIDYNRSGTFDAGEWTSLGSNSTSSYPTYHTATVVVPAVVSDGWSKMRIRSDYYGYTPGATDACTSGNPYYYGETQDYYVYLVGLPANPGNPTEGATPVSCTAGTTLTPTGTPSNSRIKWYWESSASDTTHTYGKVVNGAKTIYSNGTYYVRAYDTIYKIWSTGAGSKVVSDFPAGPASPANTVITSSGNPGCYTGSTLSSALAPSAGITYFWQTLPTNTANTDTAATNVYSKSKFVSAPGNYYVKAQDSVGCWSTGAASITQVLLPALAASTFSTSQITGCGGSGTVTVATPSYAPLLPWYSNNFNGTFTNGPAAALFGTASISGGYCILNPAAASQTGGGIQVFNPSGLNANAFTIDYDFQTIYGNGNADGFSYSFGDDVVQIPNAGSTFTGSISGTTLTVTVAPATPITIGQFITGTGVGSNTYVTAMGTGTGGTGTYIVNNSQTVASTTLTSTGTNPENGSGTKLKLSFDAYANGTNVQGIYLMYNCTTQNQTPTSPGVIGFVANTSWFSTATTNSHVQIVITPTGYITVKLNGTAIFNNIPLPASYLAATKTNWSHVFCARTGSVYEQHAIDNFVVQYNSLNYYQYSSNGGATWQTNNVFGLPTGTYPISVTYAANPSCSATAVGSPAVINNFHVTPGTVTTNIPVFCVAGIPTFTVTGNQGGIQWQQSLNSNGPWTNVGSVNSATYTPLSNLTANTYVRVYSNCPTTGIQPNIDSSSNYMQSVLTPTVTSVTPAIHCGFGTGTLSATVNAGSTANWYATSTATTAQTGGSATLSYTPPASSTTTNYYVRAAGATPVTANLSLTSPFSYYSTYQYGLTFNANRAFTLTTVKVFAYAATAGTAGTVSVALVNSTGTILQSATVNVLGYPQTTANLIGSVVTLNFYVPVGTNYGLQCTGYTGISGLLYEYGPGGTGANFAYPFTDFTNSCSIIGGNLVAGAGVPTTTYLYYYASFYDWNISWQCESNPATKDSLKITAAPAVTITNGNPNACLGQSSTLVASSVLNPTGYTYSWTAAPLTGSGFTNPTAGATVTATPTVSATYPSTAPYVYTVVATDNTTGPYAGCAYQASTTINTKPLPPMGPTTASPATLCASTTGYPSSTTLASKITAPAAATLGTGSTFTATTTTYPTPYGLYYTGAKEQYLVLASELTAGGFTAGSKISSLAFNVYQVNSPNGTCGTNTGFYRNFTIAIAGTTVTALTGYNLTASSFTTCYTLANPSAGFQPTTGWNTYNFQNSYTWNGTDNIIIDVSFVNNANCPTTATCYTLCDQIYYHTTSFNSVASAHADGSCTVNTFSTTSTPTIYATRPDMKINGSFQTTTGVNWAWSPITATTASTTASPAPTPGVASTIKKYYVTATNSTTGCIGKDSVTVTVNQPPSIAVQPVSTSGTACAYTSTSTFTVTGVGAGTLGYQWQDSTATGWVNITNGTLANGTVYSGTTTSTLSVSGYPYSMNGHKYHVVVSALTGGCNPSVASNTVKLNFRQPASAVLSGSQSMILGNNATLSVALTGTAPWSITVLDSTTNVSTTYTGIASSPYTFQVSPSTINTYKLASLTDGNGCTTNSTSDISGRAIVDVYAINDDCSTAIPLNLTVGCNYTNGTSFNGHASGQASCTGSALTANPDDDVWYEVFIPAGLPSITVQVISNGNFDAAFEILKGTCAGMTSLACRNQSSIAVGAGSLETYVLNTNAIAPATLYIRVYDARTGWGASTGGNGLFQICTYGLIVPSNGTPCNAISLSNNSGSIANHPNQVTSFDKAPNFGLINDDPNGTGTGFCYTPTSTPASGVAGTYKPLAANLVYYQGTTSFGSSYTGEPMPPGITNTGNTQKIVWFQFKAPTVYDAAVDLNVNFASTASYNAGTQLSNWVIALYTISGYPCSGPTFTPVYYNGTTSPIYTTNGKVNISGADFAYNNLAGQTVYAELFLTTGSPSYNAAGGSYLLAIHASTPNINLQSPTTATLSANYTNTLLGVSQYKLFWRHRPNPATNWCQTVEQGGGGYSYTYPTTSPYVITGLTSGDTYDSWMQYIGVGGDYFASKTVSLGTTIGCSAQQPAPYIKHVVGHCSRDTFRVGGILGAAGVTVPHPTLYPYRIYWLPTGSNGYYVYSSSNINNLITNLAVNGHSYDFFYGVICTGGATVKSAVKRDTTCYGAQTPITLGNGNDEHITYEVDGVYYVDVDIREVISAYEAAHPTTDDGQTHFYPLHRVDMPNAISSTSTEASAEDVLTGGFSLIPNPTSNRVKVEYNLPDENLAVATIKLMDMTGRVIREIKLDNPVKEGWVSLDLNDLNSGVYLVNVQTEGYTETKKLVVNK